MHSTKQYWGAPILVGLTQDPYSQNVGPETNLVDTDEGGIIQVFICECSVLYLGI